MSKKRVGMMIIGIVVIVLIILVCAILPPSSGKIPQFRDENGEVLKDSLASKEYIDIDGEKIGIILLAKDIHKPVLLVCGGGPGIPQYLLESFYPSTLPDEFVVCYIEYRGTGLSYRKDTNVEEMTDERYLEDVRQITEYLSERFQQERIYLMGHSFGSGIALQTAQRNPDEYIAYLAMSQVCDQKRSEILAYDYMKEQYEINGNQAMVKKFEQYPIHESEESYQEYSYSFLRDQGMHDLGVGTTREMKSVITDIFFPSLRCTAYKPMERINIWRGKVLSNQFALSIDDLNAFTDVPKLEIPIFFLAGQYDYTCCYSLQKEYYEAVEAPLKEFFTFEESAHSPIYEEPQKAQEIFIHIKNITGYSGQ